MVKEISKLLLFSEPGEDSILLRLAEIFEAWEKGTADADALRRRVLRQMKRLLDLSTDYGFDTDLWQCYLTFLLITNENSFTLTCERAGPGDGTVNRLAKSDFAVFKRLFDFDFGPIEAALGLDCFTTVRHYKAIQKRERMYNRGVSDAVRRLRAELDAAPDAEGMFSSLTAFYQNCGVGMFGLDRAFRIRSTPDGGVTLLPVSNIDRATLSDLVGCELQKRLLTANTDAFVEGRPANNVLLYGDSGTGKSTSVKALINEYYDRGLRMIEIYKHQFRSLSDVIARVKNRNYRFIIFIDDLSFEENEVEYKYLKAVIEGGVETRPDNVLIYATSNRRHLIRETWGDRQDMEHDGDVHRSDTLEEKLSLSARFGVLINYATPDRAAFNDIVLALAARNGVEMDENRLLLEANRWELRHGGPSGRTAQQFISFLLGGQ